MNQATYLDLFAGIPVTDYSAALQWYQRLLGSSPAVLPHDTEAVWELAERRYVYIVQQPEHAGHARHTLFVENLMRSSRASLNGDSTQPIAKPIRTACARFARLTRPDVRDHPYNQNDSVTDVGE